MHGRRYRDVRVPRSCVSSSMYFTDDGQMQDHSDSIQRWTESAYFDDLSEDGSSYFSPTSDAL